MVPPYKQDGQYTVEYSARSSDEFRLICDPFFSSLPDDEQETLRVPASRTYDLVYLGKRKQGPLMFRLALHGSGDRMTLELEQLWRRNETVPLHFATKSVLSLPLYYDRNSSCIHVGERDRDISELGLGLPPQPTDEGGQASSDDSSDSDGDSSMDSDFHL